MQPNSPQEIEARVNARFRIFLTLWAAILASIMLLTVFAVAVPSKGLPNPILSYSLLVVCLTVVTVSLLLKQRLVQQAIEKSSVESLQTALVLSLALCESAALFGLFAHFVTGSKTSWFAFAIAVAGVLLHFPNKDHVRAVSGKPPIR
jgi:F0F1-type ATP synthase membrane subunit c/vacuolar-type H+-ATPase subunit K